MKTFLGLSYIVSYNNYRFVKRINFNIWHLQLTYGKPYLAQQLKVNIETITKLCYLNADTCTKFIKF